MNQGIRERMKQLVNLINQYDYEYYVLNSPSVSDAEYDTLYKELVELEERYPEYALSYSPTKRVGGKVQEGFSEVEHLVPMLSLENAQTKDELKKFIDNVAESLKASPTFTVEYKFDGLACSVVYQDGLFV
ncbi:MAG: NAD-dependent DNA ligase LigA, partial [Deltaproteobacteria bacterium]|nr:NAD-dependent DNA ligase LigA [Deltaproteobacteria bacterium]